MKTRKATLNAIDAALIDASQHGYHAHYVGMLNAAEAAHGCIVRVKGESVYELRRVYGAGITPKSRAIAAVDAVAMGMWRNDMACGGVDTAACYRGALRAAEAVHGCRLTIVDDGIYEWRKVFTRVAVMPKDDMCAKYGEHKAH